MGASNGVKNNVHAVNRKALYLLYKVLFMSAGVKIDHIMLR
jgi:hypothetical protein